MLRVCLKYKICSKSVHFPLFKSCWVKRVLSLTIKVHYKSGCMDGTSGVLSVTSKNDTETVSINESYMCTIETHGTIMEDCHLLICE